MQAGGIPAGSYPVELSVCLSRVAGLRIAAARLLLSETPAVSYEVAMPKGKERADFGVPGVFTFFGVDAGLACFADSALSEENRIFFEQWEKENPGKNKYLDYFAALFKESCQAHPEFQNQGTGFLEWKLPKKRQQSSPFFQRNGGRRLQRLLGTGCRRGDYQPDGGFYESGVFLSSCFQDCGSMKCGAIRKYQGAKDLLTSTSFLEE